MKKITITISLLIAVAASAQIDTTSWGSSRLLTSSPYYIKKPTNFFFVFYGDSIDATITIKLSDLPKVAVLLDRLFRENGIESVLKTSAKLD